MRTEYKNDITMDPSGFVLLADFVPHIVQEIRYYSTYNFIGERIDGYEEPCAILTKEAARVTWRIPWTEEPGGLQSMWLQRVR